MNGCRKKGFNFRNVLIVGSRQRAIDAINTIGDRLGAGFRVIGCIEVAEKDVGKNVANGCAVIGTMDKIETILRENVVDELIFAMPLIKIPDGGKYIALGEKMGVSVRIIPDWQLHHVMYRPGIAKINFEEFLGIPTISRSFWVFQPWLFTRRLQTRPDCLLLKQKEKNSNA